VVTNLAADGNTSIKSHRFPLLSADETSDKVKEPGGSLGASEEGLIAALEPR